MTADERCTHCGRRITHNNAVQTRAGARAKRCADKLPTRLRRPPKPRPKEKAS